MQKAGRKQLNTDSTFAGKRDPILKLTANKINLPRFHYFTEFPFYREEIAEVSDSHSQKSVRLGPETNLVW